jgi:SAP domain
MPARDATRWQQNEDGTYRRTQGRTKWDRLESVSYDDMTKAELEAELEVLGLPKTGNKDELIERLKAA